MPIQTRLIRDGRVLLNTYTEPLDIGDVSDMVDQNNEEFFDKALKPLHTIDDVTLIKDLPPNLLSDARPIIPKRHAMAGRGYIVARAGLLSIVARTLLKVIGKEDLQVSYSLEEALGQLDEVLKQEAGNAI